ncbi:MAG: hypothetical protein K2G45_10105 [Lachnospiraceae bacterium]|nr:hypothetical protein [Lachnospiraceae bacterium]
MGNKKKNINDMLLNYADDMYVIPDVDKSKIMNMYGKKKNVMPILGIAVVALLAIGIIAKAVIITQTDTLANEAYEFTDEAFERGVEILRSKVEVANMSEEEFQLLVDEIGKDKEFYRNIENVPELKMNEYGQTYGVEILKPDLVSIASIYREGEERRYEYWVGDLFVYWDERHPEETNATNGNLSYIKRSMIYLSDGRTQMGYLFPNGVATTRGISDDWNFMTDEELDYCIEILKDKVKEADLSEGDFQKLIIDLYLGASPKIIDELINDDGLKVNEYGQTYGSDTLYYPDLIKVVSDDGQYGYVYKSEMEADRPKSMSPEDIEAFNNAPSKVYDVYKSDGKTVIGYMSSVTGVVIE